MATFRLTSKCSMIFDRAPVYPDDAKDTDKVAHAVTDVKSHFRWAGQL
jgi:hypothetical protein